jgi:hypothetical protein
VSSRITGSRHRVLLSVAGAATLALATLVAVPGASAQEIPGVDEVVSSDNMHTLANHPKQAPFDTPSSIGSDIAFQGRYAFDGNFNGFTIYDIKNPRKPAIVSQVLCPGSQNDISVSGDLLFLSTDSARTNNTCQSQSTSPSDPNSWEGVKVFDISDKRNPRYVKDVRTDCGSHTHTLVPDKRGKDVYLYVSSYFPAAEFPNCQPPHDKISIVKVPRKDPAKAAIVATPVLFPDGGNDNTGGLAPTTGCHDITVYAEKNLAAGACMGDGILMDISDREKPRVLHTVQDNANFAFWHSATFNNRASKVVFTDELGGGVGATCNTATGPTHGANGIYDIEGKGDKRRLVFRSYYKIPRPQGETENCVAHNGSLIPVRGRDVMVQAWYQGGMSVWDFTDSRRPKDIGFWERGPLPNGDFGGAWSTYYYNGHIYSSDIQKGLDVVDLRDPRTDSAKSIRVKELNAQTQQSYRH